MPRWEEEKKKEGRRNDSLVNAASITTVSAERLHCSEKRLDFSNKDTFDFSVAFRCVHGKKRKPSCLQLCVLFKSAALSTPKQTSSAEVILSPVSAWHGLTGCCAF